MTLYIIVCYSQDIDINFNMFQVRKHSSTSAMALEFTKDNVTNLEIPTVKVVGFVQNQLVVTNFGKAL